MTQPTPPGWYRDANGNNRFWNGTNWTDQPPPAQSSYAPPPAPPPAPPAGYATSPLPVVPGPPQRDWYRRRGFLIAGAIIGALIVIGAIGSALSSPKKNASSTTALTTPAPPITASSPALTPSTSSKVVVPPAPATTTSAAGGDGSFTMPNEVGHVLQDAQDDIQRVSGDPVFFTHSHDLLGNRFQVLDRNWKVCNQNVPSGSRVSAIGHIDFGVVKLTETCP